ncbi:enterobactin synthase subunit EntD [Enterobacter soli]|uniref:enterobactin synthase subunit EntD n=1 Tax=Enterobacter soli TaxID=885040 RepID=UPI0034CF0339
MHITYSTRLLARHAVHCIAFDPSGFTDADLLWLPHHAELAHAGRKRKADHLAGRIAAAHALNALDVRAVPGIGPSGEPLWPAGVSGSITHSGTLAMAIAVARRDALIGIDCEAILPAEEAREIKDGVIDALEEPLLTRSGYPFALALTLAFSAKESLFKALFPQVKTYMGFDAARVTHIEEHRLTLALTQSFGEFDEGTCFTLDWQRVDGRVCTLIVA